jgi:predicted nuclease of predicted toxin-antitoxin system
MIALLLDQGLAPGAAQILRERGFDAVHVIEIGLDRAEDSEILSATRLQNRVCVTLDRDFHSHLAIAGHGHPSVILLRIEGLAAGGQADLIDSICATCEAVLREGAAVSADGRSLRIRRLPLR